MVTLYTLFIAIFNIVQSLSIVPDCNSIKISCPDNDPSCCQGPCCQFLHQYQTPQSLTNPYYTNPRILTNTNPFPNIPSNPNIQSIIVQNLPKLNEQCSTRFATRYQCDKGLQCKFTGQNTVDLYLLGQCKVPTEGTGCNYDDDCYRFNDKCINGRCTMPLSFPPPIPPQMPPQRPPAQPQCGNNEVFSPCNGHCRPTCATGTMIMCTMQCQAGCNCKDGYILDEAGGECIAIDQCPSKTSPIPPQLSPQTPSLPRPVPPVQLQCGVNEVFTACNGHCRPTCATGEMIACTMQCERGCNCKDGYILNEVGGECIAIDQCPSKTQIQPQINGGSVADPMTFSRAGAVSDNLDEHETEIKGGRRNIPFSLSKQAQLVIGLLAFLCALAACYKCCSVLFEIKGGSRKNTGDSYQPGGRSDVTVDADIEWSDNSDSNESKDEIIIDEDNEDNNDEDPEKLLKVEVDDKKDKEQNPYAEYTDDYLL